MKNTILLITTFFFIFSIGLSAQQQTTDGGYIIAGTTQSYSSGSDDFLVYKLSASGAKEWRKNFGGTEPDGAVMIKQTTDGGYIVVGYTGSYVPTPSDGCDFLVYKLDASGAKQWRKNFGGYHCDHAFGVIQTTDGGFLVIGDTSNYVHDTPGLDGDFLVYKLNAAGAKQWRKNYGGTSYDYGMRAVQTSDGGYALIGFGYSYTNGMSDVLVYKTNASGSKQWRKNFGGSDYDYGLFIRQTPDGGYILCGRSESYAHLPSGQKGGSPESDILVYKLDSSGNKQWRKNYGGVWDEDGFDIRLTTDGGYVFCGSTESYTHGEDDMIVYKVDAAGAKQWRKNFGGVNNDQARYIVPCSDGGYFLFGDNASYTNGDYDFLVYKLNAGGQKQWRKNYGGTLGDWIEVWD